VVHGCESKLPPAPVNNAYQIVHIAFIIWLLNILQSAATLHKRAPHSRSPILVIVIVVAQYIREKQQLEHKEKDYQLYDNHRPQIAARGHAAETLRVKTVHSYKKIAPAGMCISAAHVYALVCIAKLIYFKITSEKKRYKIYFCCQLCVNLHIMSHHAGLTHQKFHS
jgi:hypothetical protein